MIDKRRLPPVYSGAILCDEFLKSMQFSVYWLARAVKISRPRLNDIVLGSRAVLPFIERSSIL